MPEICFPEKTKHDVGFLDTLSWPATAVGTLATSNETCIHGECVETGRTLRRLRCLSSLRILALMLRETRLNVNDQLVYIYLEDMRPVVRRCEGNFTVGASWGPVQGVCMMRPSQRTLDLKALSMVSGGIVA